MPYDIPEIPTMVVTATYSSGQSQTLTVARVRLRGDGGGVRLIAFGVGPMYIPFGGKLEICASEVANG